MNNTENLKLLIRQMTDNHSDVNNEFKYIDTGNPDANILIIGKEASIAPDRLSNQYHGEILDNLNAWKKLENYDQELVRSKDWANYTPLYPYKSQVLKINNGQNDGTSRTWYNYQKLYNLIFKKPDNHDINFHEKMFITEVNSTPNAKTKDASLASIPFRKEHFLTSDFIKGFPLILICGVGYFKISYIVNEIEEIFKVKFSERKVADGNKKQLYWIHWNEDKTKLLTNTYQLSIYVSDGLLKAIANEILESRLII